MRDTENHHKRESAWIGAAAFIAGVGAAWLPDAAEAASVAVESVLAGAPLLALAAIGAVVLGAGLIGKR